MTTHAPEGQAPSTSPQYGGTPARNWALPLIGIVVDVIFGALVIPAVIFLVIGIRRHRKHEGSYGWNMALMIVSGLTVAGTVLFYGALALGSVALNSASHRTSPAPVSAVQSQPSQQSSQPAQQQLNLPAESEGQTPQVVVQELDTIYTSAFANSDVQTDLAYLSHYYESTDSQLYQQDAEKIQGGMRLIKRQTIVDANHAFTVVSQSAGQFTAKYYAQQNDFPVHLLQGTYVFLPSANEWRLEGLKVLS